MPKIQKNKIEQCTKIFIYRDLKRYIRFNTIHYYSSVVIFEGHTLSGRPLRGISWEGKKLTLLLG